MRICEPLRGIAAAACLGMLWGCAGAPQPRTGAEFKDVMAVLDRQVEAWNRKDLDGFMEGYLHSPDTTYFGGAAEVRGFAAILERYRTRYKSEGKEMGQLAFRSLDIEVLDPSAALVRGRWHLKTSAAEVEGLFTLLLKKSPAGWKIVHDHTSGG